MSVWHSLVVSPDSSAVLGSARSVHLGLESVHGQLVGILTLQLHRQVLQSCQCQEMC